MAQRSLILRYLRRTLADPATDVSDAELLRRFVAERDEAAFELLLWRHAAMVLGLCRALLRHEQDAEDAFQATFLALARRAGAIRRGESLAGWLYRVSYRIALRARARASRRNARRVADLDPATLPTAGASDAADGQALRELRPLLHREVQRLPAKYLQPVVLCYLEGLTHAEAARQLGWPRGTVAGRLARARDLLRRRLRHSGLAPSAALCLAALSPGVTAAPPELLRTTARAGALVAAGGSAAGAVSPEVVALTEGV
jgi:RNA polymerase sigma factor (sigma-70 family)